MYSRNVQNSVLPLFFGNVFLNEQQDRIHVESNRFPETPMRRITQYKLLLGNPSCFLLNIALSLLSVSVLPPLFPLAQPFDLLDLFLPKTKAAHPLFPDAKENTKEEHDVQ